MTMIDKDGPAKLPTQPLTPREIDVVCCAAAGQTSAQIAEALRISKRTVDFHKDNIMHKYRAHTMLEVLVKTCDIVVKIPGRGAPR